MFNRKFILPALLIFIVAWVILEVVINRHWLLPATPVEVRIEVAGKPEGQIEAIFDVDGVATSQTRMLPTTFNFPHVRKLMFTIKRGTGSGELWCTVFINERQSGPYGGGAEWVRGMIERGYLHSTAGQGEPKGIWE